MKNYRLYVRARACLLVLHRVEHVAIFGGLHLAPGVGWPSPVTPRGKMIRRSRLLDPNGRLAVQSGAPENKLG
jgi:hypothetical protein